MPSRRNILKSIGAGTTVITASTLGSAVDDGIEIVTGARGDEPSTTRVVSEEWYDHVLAVREAQSELLTTARNNSAIRKGLSRANTDKSSNPLITDPISVKRVSTDEEIGGLHYRKVDSYNNGYLELIGPHVRHDVNSNGSHEVSYCPAAFEISNQHDVVFNTSDCGY